MSSLSPAERKQMNATMLLLEDTPVLQERYTKQFEAEGWTVYAFTSAVDARKKPTTLAVADVALLDHNLNDDETGTEFGIWLRREYGTNISTVVYTAAEEEQIAKDIGDTELIDEFFKKSSAKRWDEERLSRLDALLAKAREGKNEFWINPVSDDLDDDKDAYEDPWPSFIKTSVQDYIAESQMPVLILGETGTGKERLARMIHENSGLPHSNYRAINCAAFTEQLVMSELFGHVYGSFTGAIRNKVGVILEAAGAKVDYRTNAAKDDNYKHWLEACGNTFHEDAKNQLYEFNQADPSRPRITGTLFLDEIGDLSKVAQAAVLRFLDSYGIRPIGYSDMPIRPRLRIIAATNKPEVVGIGDTDSFRTDLLWRLGGWIINMPSLKDRPKDTIVAARKRVRAFNKIHNKTLKLSPSAERQLREMATKTDKPMFSDSNDPLRDGNFRHLNWVVDRACWLVTNRDPDDADASEIPAEIIDRAARPLDKTWIASPERHDELKRVAALGGDESVDGVAGSIRAIAQFLGRQSGHDAAAYVDGDGNLEADSEMVERVSDFLLNRKIDFSQVKLFDSEANTFGITIDKAAVERWEYLALIAIVRVSGKKLSFTKIKNVFPVSGTTCSNHFKEIAEALLRRRFIGTVWGSNQNRRPGPVGEFVRLLYEPNIHPNKAAIPDGGMESTQFYWLDSTMESGSTRFLSHLRKIAESIAIRKP